MFQKKKRKTKKTEYQKAKDRTWKACSAYIRHKGCLETTGTFDYGHCCTCGSLKPYKDLDAGHYISGRSNSILFVDEGINIQCISCNRFNEGRKDEYERYMQNKYGSEVCEKLKNMKWIKKSLSLLELLALEQDYKEKLKILIGNISE